MEKKHKKIKMISLCAVTLLLISMVLFTKTTLFTESKTSLLQMLSSGISVSEESYTVYLEPNGGEVEKTYVSVQYGTTYGELPTPIKEGYAFKGWYLKETKIEADTTANLVSEDHTLVAEWKANQYKVIYHANGGTFTDGAEAKESQINYGDDIPLDMVSIKSPYAFLGWALEETSSACLMQKKMPAEEVHLYAVYSLPVSDIKKTTLLVWNLYETDTYKELPMTLTEKEGYGYYYEIQNANVIEGVTLGYSTEGDELSELGVALLLYDHAGNKTTIPIVFEDNWYPSEDELPVQPTMYLQTTLHHTWDMTTETWVYFASTGEQVSEGETYTPKYLEETDEKYPTGYTPYDIDEAYTVQDYTTTNAYYKPITYKMYFDANGGTCDTASKDVYQGGYIGDLPTATMKGHEFLGWFTEKDGGKEVLETDVYTAAKDTTVYAHWQLKDYNVTYNYAANGGTSAEKEYAQVKFGEAIDLDVEAVKDGWEFLGWNTEVNATKGMDALTMGDKDVVLFAIYKRNLTVTMIDRNDKETVTRTESALVYNTNESASFPVPTQNTMTGWKSLGWSTDKAANARIDYAAGSTITITENTTLYGCYEKEVTVSFDTNGSLEELDDMTETRQYNASGDDIIPSITVPEGPSMEEHSFVVWVDEDGNEYPPGSTMDVPDDTTLIARWDEFPEIEAYDRYFSLSVAQSGGITENVLYEKVKATDTEDGILTNGSDVTIIGYQASDFTSFTDDGSVSVTYAAVDSFGNRVTKLIMVYIVDTGSIEPLQNSYIRFMDKNYYMDAEGNYVPTTEGGLETTSKWITDTAYAGTLTNVLSYTKENVEKNKVDVYGTELEVPDLSTGTWPYVKTQWVLSTSAIKDVKTFVYTNGYGKFKNTNAIVDFYTAFDAYRTY